jgi:prephenate dehydrogenase
MTISVIGVGLIGGSLAIGLKENGFASHIIGVERNAEHAQKALDLRIVDEILPLPLAIAKSDIIVAATPVDSLTTLIPIILDLINGKQTVIDVGSTKLPVLEAVKSHAMRGRFVATHPMAGTEYSGPEAAVPGLFKDKCCVLCETNLSDTDALTKIEALYAALQMRITTLGGTEHDLHTAYVSHISHIASFALALTVLEKEKAEDRIFELASGGFSSTVRLAKSNPETWIPIFRQNRDNVLDVLDEFINTVSKFRTLLIKKDFDSFQTMIEQANDIKRIIG